MKAIEFKSKMKNKSIRVPDNFRLLLSENKDIRVIILFDEKEQQEGSDFKTFATEQFLNDYSDIDSIYDNY